MKELCALLSRNANYVYHMLSVGRAGYDNEYGKKYVNIHPSRDMENLNQLKSFITVQGGEHCGELYWLFSQPASFSDDISLKEFYSALHHLLSTHDIKENTTIYNELYCTVFNLNVCDIDGVTNFHDSLVPLSKEISQIAKVMESNYDIYFSEVWDIEKTSLQNAVDEANAIFSKKDYIGLWESITGYSYPYSKFYAVLCNSIRNGPQAIDIGNDRDIFCTPDDYHHFTQLVSHEVGIYILKENFKDLINDSTFFKYYKLFESLAGFYNKLIFKEDIICWSGEQKYKDFYRDIYGENLQMSPRDLFLKAINIFIN